MPGTDRFRSSLPCRLPARPVTRHIGMTRPDRGADKASAKSGTTETAAPCRGLYGCCPEAMSHFPSSPPPPRHLQPQASSCRPCAAVPHRILPLPQHAPCTPLPSSRHCFSALAEPGRPTIDVPASPANRPKMETGRLACSPCRRPCEPCGHARAPSARAKAAPTTPIQPRLAQ